MGKSQENIRDIIMQAVEAGRISAERTAKDAFKATERRLYGLPTLKIKLEDDLERLEEFKLYGPRERSKSITRFVKNGNRLTPDEIWEAVLMDMEATIAADRYEIETLERALATVRDDPYYGQLADIIQQLIDDGENLLATGFTQADIDDLLGEIGGELGEDEEPPSLGKKEDIADGIKCTVGDFSFRLEEAEFEDLMADVREKVGFTQELVCAELKGRLFDEV